MGSRFNNRPQRNRQRRQTQGIPKRQYRNFVSRLQRTKQRWQALAREINNSATILSDRKQAILRSARMALAELQKQRPNEDTIQGAVFLLRDAIGKIEKMLARKRELDQATSKMLAIETAGKGETHKERVRREMAKAEITTKMARVSLSRLLLDFQNKLHAVIAGKNQGGMQ